MRKMWAAGAAIVVCLALGGLPALAQDAGADRCCPCHRHRDDPSAGRRSSRRRRSVTSSRCVVSTPPRPKRIDDPRLSGAAHHRRQRRHLRHRSGAVGDVPHRERRGCLGGHLSWRHLRRDRGVRHRRGWSAAGTTRDSPATGPSVGATPTSSSRSRASSSPARHPRRSRRGGPEPRIRATQRVGGDDHAQDVGRRSGHRGVPGARCASDGAGGVPGGGRSRPGDRDAGVRLDHGREACRRARAPTPPATPA